MALNPYRRHLALTKCWFRVISSPVPRSQRLASGINVPDTIYSQLQACAEKLNFTLSEDLVEAADVERYQV